MSEASPATKRDRFASIALSIALHAAVAGAIFVGWWRIQHAPKPPQPTLAIEATVVDAKSLQPARQVAREPVKPAVDEQPPPQPEPAPVPVPPQPTPAEVAQKQQQEEAQREDVERQAAEAKAHEQQSQKEAEQRQQEDSNRADQQRKELDAKRDADAKRAAEAKRITEEKRAADEKHAAEEKRQAQEKQQADAKRVAEEKRKADEAQQRAQTEADLQQSLKAEEHAMAVRSSGALASWVAQITARIQRAWIRPPSALLGLDCTIEVTQVPGGQVTNVSLGACNGDQAVRESIEAAVYRASPLPPPPDPSLFERDLQIRFAPTE